MLHFGGVPICMIDFPMIDFSVFCPILAPGVDRGIGWSPKGNGHEVLAYGHIKRTGTGINQKDVNISLIDASADLSAGLAKDHLPGNDSKGILMGELLSSTFRWRVVPL